MQGSCPGFACGKRGGELTVYALLRVARQTLDLIV